MLWVSPGRPCERRLRERGRGLRCALALLLSCIPLQASAQPTPGAVPLNDLIEVLVVDREMLAFDGVQSKTFREELQIDEHVIFSGQQGAVGVIFTSRRALAVTSKSGSWKEVKWRLDETIPERPLLGDRIALATTERRAIGFDAGSGIWAESDVGPNEKILDAQVGANTGVVVTNRRALGISPGAGGFRDTRLRLHEEIEKIHAGSSIATITTSNRLLIFRGVTAAWSSRDRH